MFLLRGVLVPRALGMLKELLKATTIRKTWSLLWPRGPAYCTMAIRAQRFRALVGFLT